MVLQSLWDRLLRWVSTYRPELACTIPLALLVAFGLFHAPPWAYGILLAVLTMLVLLCNPLHIWDRLLPPRTRTLMAAGILVGLLPLSFYNMALSAKVCIWALAVGMECVAIWRRRLWLGLFRIRQSPDVDNILAHLSHDGDWEAGRAWENYGCRETRALLHQTLWAVCNETEMQQSYMPVYLLGYLHGKAAEQRQHRRAEADKATLTDQARIIQDQQAEIATLKASNADLVERLSQAEQRAGWQRQYTDRLEQRLQNAELTPEQRDAAILVYVEQGHSYAEAGTKYGLSKSGAVAAYKRAKAQKEADQ